MQNPPSLAEKHTEQRPKPVFIKSEFRKMEDFNLLWN